MQTTPNRHHSLGQLFLRNLRRAVAIALLVGTVLILVNHGDHIEREPVCDYFLVKAGLCYVVPFMVSMVSVLLSESRRPG